jgi:hypothetical protein
MWGGQSLPEKNAKSTNVLRNAGKTADGLPFLGQEPKSGDCHRKFCKSLNLINGFSQFAGGIGGERRELKQ